MALDIRNSILSRLAPSPVAARHFEYSMLYSADDAKSHPSPRLLSIGLEAANRARDVSLRDVSARMDPPHYPDVWPGEHYRLLGALVQTMKPKVVIEIGTASGLSALSMKKFLDPDAKLVTFDVVPWASYPPTYLFDSDFQNGQLVQYTDDLTDPAMVRKHAELLSNADLLFIDAAKDGKMERTFLDNFRAIHFRSAPVLVFDDIRLWKMLKIWREISMPKLDLTSFGHWCGTGLVEWIP